ncbi:hypothetical protein D3C81_1579550 [compost metagenome]
MGRDFAAGKIPGHVADHDLLFAQFDIVHGSAPAPVKPAEETRHVLGVQCPKGRRVPARILVFVDQQGAHTFYQVAALEPLAVQMQLKGEALFKGQLASAAEHFQGDAHGQG